MVGNQSTLGDETHVKGNVSRLSDTGVSGFTCYVGCLPWRSFPVCGAPTTLREETGDSAGRDGKKGRTWFPEDRRAVADRVPAR